MTNKQMVDEFHKRFRIQYSSGPRRLNSSESLFRITALHEELGEYMVAVQKDDLEGQLDALVDMLYFVYGTAHRQGFDIDGAFDVVHQANMTKVNASRSTDSKRGFKGDIVKPDDFVAPDLSRFVIR